MYSLTQEGAVAWWDNANLTDKINSYVLVGEGNADENTNECLDGDCLQLNGGYYHSVNPQDDFDFLSQDGFSAHAWVRFNSSISSDSTAVGSHTSDPTGGWGMGLEQLSPTYYRTWTYSSGSGWQAVDSATGATSYQDTWVLLSYIKNGNTFYTCVNSTCAGSNYTITDYTHTADPYLFVGSRFNGTSRYWYGQINQIIIYNRTNTYDEISDIYNSGTMKTYEDFFVPVTPNETCIYSGSGDWYIDQDCQINLTTDLLNNSIVCNGTGAKIEFYNSLNNVDQIINNASCNILFNSSEIYTEYSIYNITSFNSWTADKKSPQIDNLILNYSYIIDEIDGLVAYYPFDHDINDYFGNYNWSKAIEGQFANGSYSYKDLPYNFTGTVNTSINIVDNDDLAIMMDQDPDDNSYLNTICTNGCSFTMWFNVQDTVNNQYLLHKRNSVDIIYSSSNNLLFRIYDGALNLLCTAAISNYPGYSFGSEYDTHHGAFIYNNSHVSIYIDGKFNISTSCSDPVNMVWFDSNYFIGLKTSSGYPAIGFFAIDALENSTIDDLRFYNRSLNSTEINLLANKKRIELYDFELKTTRKDDNTSIKVNITNINSSNSYLSSIFEVDSTQNITLGTWNYTTENYYIQANKTYYISSNTTFAFNLDTTIQLSLKPILYLDNCSTYSDILINFSIYDINTGSALTGDSSGYFEGTPFYGSETYKFNLSWFNLHDFQICTFNFNTSFLLNGQLEYNSTGYTTNTYYFQQDNITNSSVDIPLYLDNGTSTATFIVNDENDNPVSDVLISILEYELTTDDAKVVSIIKTDSNGQALGDIILNTKRYKFILSINNVIYLETTPVILTTTGPHTFRINLISDFTDIYDKILNVNCDLSYDNETEKFTFIYSDQDNEIDEGCLIINKYSGTINTEVLNNCLSTKSGELTYTITDNSTTYLATAIIKYNDQDYVCGVYDVDFDVRRETYKTFGLFVSFLVIICLFFVAVLQPVVSILLTLVAIIGLNMLGLLVVSWATIISLCIIVGFAMYRMNR